MYTRRRLLFYVYYIHRQVCINTSKRQHVQTIQLTHTHSRGILIESLLNLW